MLEELEKSLSGGRQSQKPKPYRHPNHRTRRPQWEYSNQEWPAQQSSASPSRPSRCRDMPQQQEAWRNQPHEYPQHWQHSQHLQAMPQRAQQPPPKTPVITGTASNLPPSAAVRGDASARVAAPPAPTGDASARGAMIPLSTSPVGSLRSAAHMPSPLHSPPHRQHRPMPFANSCNMAHPDLRAQRGAWTPQPPAPMPMPPRSPMTSPPTGYQLNTPLQQSPVSSPQRTAFPHWQQTGNVSPNRREQQMACAPRAPCAPSPTAGQDCAQTAAAELLRKFNDSPQDLAAALMAAQPDVYED